MLFTTSVEKCAPKKRRLLNEEQTDNSNFIEEIESSGSVYDVNHLLEENETDNDNDLRNLA